MFTSSKAFVDAFLFSYFCLSSQAPSLASQVYINSSAMRHVQYSIVENIEAIKAALSSSGKKGDEVS